MAARAVAQWMPSHARFGRPNRPTAGGSASEDLWRALQQANDLIRLADAKAGVVLAASAALNTVLVRGVPAADDPSAEPIRVVLWLVALIAGATCSLSALLVLLPQRGGRTRVSLLTFFHVAQRFGGAPDDFVDRLLRVAADRTRMAGEIAEQIWVANRIAHRKFRAVSVAVAALTVSLVAAGTAAVVGGLW
jgi:hypothetical protein